MQFEKMPAEKNYSVNSFKVTVLVIAMMLGLSFIPPFTVAGVKFKRTNILSDILTIGRDSVGGSEFDDSADRIFIEEMERREVELATADALPSATQVNPVGPVEPREQTWNIGGASADETIAMTERPVVNGETIIPIEDYSGGEGVTISDFCRKLGEVTSKRLVRIAFLGDSYIEGDIITADVRDQLQALYGGVGVGFIPFSTPLSTHRPTVKHSYSGWCNYNVVKKKAAPEAYADKFFVSGTISVPDSSGAWAEYETTGYRRRSAYAQSMRVIFENEKAAALKLIINDSIERRFTPEPGEQVQQIRVGGTKIKKIRVDVEDPAGFIGYGVVMESPAGVGVDNYSIRSNSGMAIFGTGAKVNAQIGRMLGYELIVLQYGLNAMSPEVTNYAGYRQNMVHMVNYVKRSFPGAAILLMGVGDRSSLLNGEFVTMPAVFAMIKEQRTIARECGVAFWDTFAAMGGEKSMAAFVEKGWAAKDYTHLSFGGGRYIAKQLVNALLYARDNAGNEDMTQEPSLHASIGASGQEKVYDLSAPAANASQVECGNGAAEPQSPQEAQQPESPQEPRLQIQEPGGAERLGNGLPDERTEWEGAQTEADAGGETERMDETLNEAGDA